MQLLIALQRSRHARWLAILLPTVLVAWLRWQMVGGPPFTDGGTYVYNAWLAQEVGGSLPTAPINFYSWLASLFGIDPDAPFARARMFDACAAAVAAGLFGYLLTCVARWPVALLLACLWGVVSAAPVFVDAGFKNPIAAAMAPLFVAVSLLVRRGAGNGFGPFGGALRSGLAVALACLLREAMAPAALLVPIAWWLLHGWRSALRCAVGGILGAVLILSWMWAVGVHLGDALQHLAAMSRNANNLLAFVGSDPAEVRMDSLQLAWDRGWCAVTPVLLAGLALFARIPRRRLQRVLVAAAALWLLPLAEIFGKFCVAYHVAQLLPALVLLAAFGDRRLAAWSRCRRAVRWLRVCAWLLIVACCVFGSQSLRRELDAGRYWHGQYRAIMLDGDWHAPQVEQSRYLQIARWLRQHGGPDSRLMVSGYAYGLYPLSGMRPASIEVSDLTFSRMTDQAQRHPEWLEALREARPEFVLETLRWPEPLAEVWPDFEQRYELAVEWPRAPSLHYGHFPARLWQLRR